MASVARGCVRFCGFWGLLRNHGSYCLAPEAGGVVAASLRRASMPTCMDMGHSPGNAQHVVCGLSKVHPIFVGLRPAQYGSVSSVRAFSALQVERGTRTPCHLHASSSFIGNKWILV